MKTPRRRLMPYRITMRRTMAAIIVISAAYTAIIIGAIIIGIITDGK